MATGRMPYITALTGICRIGIGHIVVMHAKSVKYTEGQNGSSKRQYVRLYGIHRMVHADFVL